MNEDPDFIYSFSAPAVLSMVEKTDPYLFAQIKERVKEGRWELAEGWWLQADCESASGESYVRQGLYGQKYLESRFGMRSETVFNIDSFGHAGTLPQILVGCGFKNYAFWRPDREAYTLPSPAFIWRGTDGSEVTAYRVGGDGGEIFTEDFESQTVKPALSGGFPEKIVVYGVTDHGGAPTKKQMEIIRAYRDKGVFYDRADRSFDDIRKQPLPYAEGEIPVRFIGPSVNVSEIKKNNRIAEEKLGRAEAAAAMAGYVLGLPYPKEKLENAWYDVLFNQFHDILGGTCLKSSYFDARNLHGRAMQEADEVTHFSLQALASHIKMPGNNRDMPWNLCVFNTNGADGKVYIQTEVQWAWEFDWYKDGLELTDGNGEVLPVQIVREECVLPGFRSALLFACDLPAYGYRTFAVRKTLKPVSFPKSGESQTAKAGRYEIRAETDGSITFSDGETLRTGLFTPYVRKDICDTWGFNKTVYEDEKEPFTLTLSTVTEEGVYRGTLYTEARHGHTLLTRTFYLYEDGRIECDYRLQNQEKGAVIQHSFPYAGTAVTAGAPYGTAERCASYYEKSAVGYLSMGDSGLIGDTVFAYDFDGRTVGVTLCRAAIYGDLRREPLEDRADYLYMGQGEEEGRAVY
ncbi:MAG: hypothetical protein MJ078_04465, partial [Clostridia bacterium]|nr:hypothetical protein [Clostridia bacterium]